MPVNYGKLAKNLKRSFSVIPAKAGIQSFPVGLDSLDSGFHRSDDFLRPFRALLAFLRVKFNLNRIHDTRPANV